MARTKKTRTRKRRGPTRTKICGIWFTRHAGTGQGYFWLDGQRHYIGRYDDPDTPRRARRFVREYLARDGQPTSPDQDEITVAEVVARHWIHAERHYVRPDGTPTSELSNLRAATRRLIALYEDVRAVQFGPLALKAVRQQMIDDGLCRPSINKHIHRIRRIFRWGVAEELIAPAVYEALRAVSPLKEGRTEAWEPDPIRPVNQRHVNAIKPHVSRQVWAAVQLQLLTAARPGELLTLRPMDIKRTGKVWTARLNQHKTAHRGDQRELLFGPRAQKILRSFLLRPTAAPLFSPAEAERERRAENHAERTVPPHHGNAPGTNRKRNPRRKPEEHYTTHSYRRAIHRACVAAKISKWSPHRLRHSAATSIRREFGLEVASIILGHKSLVVTQTYAEGNRKRAMEIMWSVG